MSRRVEYSRLLDFTASLFAAEGLDQERAVVIARGFLEADLLGFRTHGLAKVANNLDWLRTGETTSDGEPLRLVDRPALANWDAHRLPGHWALHRAVTHGVQQARSQGTFTMTLRRCQHVACLAAALIPVIDAELIALMMVSSPEEAYVSPFGGSERLFSNNPLAFTAPASIGPILFDVSMAITAGGQIAQAARRGALLPEASIKTSAGLVTRDPEEMLSGGSVMPIGGTSHGHKGHALTVMTEILSQALAGYGRDQSVGSSEQNSVFLQILDPAAFGSRQAYDREANHLVAMIEQSPADDQAQPVRVPGQRAWRLRAEQMSKGVLLDPDVLAGLTPYARAAGITLEDPQ